jgi:hypothetical protein
MATATESRLMTCQKHSIQYPEILFSRALEPERWVGKCERCSAEESLLSRAQQLAEENKAEVFRRAQEQMELCGHEIRERTDAEIESYLNEMRTEVADRRSEWEADVRRRIWEQLLLNVESEMTSEFVEQLRKEG